MLAKNIIQSVLEGVLNKESAPKIPTSLASLDEALWGLHKKELLVIAGRTSSGKTALATQIAFNVSAKHKVIYVSLEMTKEQLIERIICNQFSINSESMRSGACREDIINKQQEILDMFKDRGFIIVDDIGRTVDSLEAELGDLAVMPDVLVVDHLQQISVRGKSRLEALDEYVRYLKEFALRNNVAVVLVSQLNRGSEETDRPYIWQIKSCGSVEEVMDTGILIWNHDKGTTLLIEKQRHGPTGKLNVNFEKWYYRFGENSIPQSVHDVAGQFGGKIDF